MKTQSPSYREILEREFNLRCKHRPGYSLRAFARDLKVSVSLMIEVMKGKKGISPTMAAKITKGLNLSLDETELFLNLVTAAHARSPKAREIANLKALGQIEHSKHFTHLDADCIAFISDWRYLVIYEAAKLDSFDGSAQWFVKALNFEPAFVKKSLELLKRLDVLSIVDRKLVFSKKNILANFTIPDPYVTSAHQSILSLARNKIASTIPAEREFISGFLPVESALLPKTKQKIREFSKELMMEHDKMHKHEQLYCYAIQFFPLSNKKTLTKM